MHKRTLVIGLAVALLLGIVATAPGVVKADSQDKPPEADPTNWGVNDSRHGLAGGEIMFLWSMDDENNSAVTFGTDTGNYSLNQTTAEDVVLASATTGDAAYKTPPKEPMMWNQGEWANYTSNFSTDKSTSYVPNGGETESGDKIKDVHATMFDISPSTKVHTGDGDPVHHIVENGTVRGLVDYRMDLPPDETGFGDDDKKVTWRLTDWYDFMDNGHEVGNVCLVRGADSPSDWSDTKLNGNHACTDRVDGTVINATDGSNTPEIEYSELSTATLSDDTDVSLVAQVNYTLKKIVVEQKERETANCQNNCQRNSGTYNERTVTRTNHYKVVSDTITVDNGRPQIAIAEAAGESDGANTTYDLAVNGDPWSAIHLNNATIHSKWRFIPLRGTGWDSITKSTDSSNSTEQGPTPVRTIGAPIGNSVDVETNATGANLTNRGAKPSITQTNLADVHERPNLQTLYSSNVNVDNAAGTEYGTAKRLVYRYSDGDTSKIGYTGMVYGENTTTNGLINAGEVSRKETKVTLTSLDKNKTHIAYKIKLTEAKSGNPIETDGREGQIEIRDQTLQTNESGVAIAVTQRNGELVVASYNPDTWWRLDDDETVYAPSYASVAQLNVVIGEGGLAAIFVDLLPFALIVLVVKYIVEHNTLGKVLER